MTLLDIMARHRECFPKKIEFQSKDTQIQTLSDQLKQVERIHQETKKSFVTERGEMESAIQSMNIQIGKLSERLEQEEISHQKTKATNIFEQKKFEIETQRKEIQIRRLSEQLKQVEETNMETMESIIAERKEMLITLNSSSEVENIEKERYCNKMEEEPYDSFSDISEEFDLESSYVENIEKETDCKQVIIGDILYGCPKCSDELEEFDLDKNRHITGVTVYDSVEQEQIRYQNEIQPLIEEREELKFKLENAIETLSTRLKEEEITNKKLKGYIIAERTKRETNLTLILFGLNWYGNSTTIDTPCFPKHPLRFFGDGKPQYTHIYQGVTINIYECEYTENGQSYINKIYRQRQTKDEDIVFLVGFRNNMISNVDHLRRFDGFLKLSKERNANMVTVFTRRGKIESMDPLKDNKDDEKDFKDLQWITVFSKTLSSKIEENNMKYLVIEHNQSFGLSGKQTELLSLCGLNIF